MKMFEAIRNLFQTKPVVGEEPLQEHTLKPLELRDYVVGKIHHVNQGLTQQIDEMRGIIDQGVAKIHDAIKVLEDGELLNPNIPIRTVQFMEGNRESFIKRVNQLVDKFDLPDDISQVEEYSSWVISKIHGHHAASAKTMQVLSQFFANEVRDIVGLISGIEKAYIETKSRMQSADIHRYEKILSKVSSIEALVKKQMSHAKEILEKKEHIRQIDQKIAKDQREIDKILQSPEFVEIKELKKTIVNYNTKTHFAEEELRHRFSGIDKAMRKFSHMSADHAGIINDYLTNPVTALQKDKTLDILMVLELVKDHVRSGEIALDDKKKEKSLQSLRILSVQYLKNLQKRIDEIQHSSSEIAHKVNKSDLNRRYLSLMHEQEELNREMQGMKERMTTLGGTDHQALELHIGEFRRMAHELFNDDVEVNI